MMYKLISDDYVVDLLHKLTYIKFLKGTTKKTITDKTNADAVLGSDNKTVYVLQGRYSPVGSTYKTVTVHEIDKFEYDKLSQLMLMPTKIVANPNTLRAAREEKISELSTICHDTIVSGVSVLLSDNFYHDFKLTVEDQVNILSIEQKIRNGSRYVRYHETGKASRLYSAPDMRKIITAVNNHRDYHTTYFNFLKTCVNNMYDVSSIKNIVYGDDVYSLNIPDKLKSEWDLISKELVKNK